MVAGIFNLKPIITVHFYSGIEPVTLNLAILNSRNNEQ